MPSTTPDLSTDTAAEPGPVAAGAGSATTRGSCCGARAGAAPRGTSLLSERGAAGQKLLNTETLPLSAGFPLSGAAARRGFRTIRGIDRTDDPAPLAARATAAKPLTSAALSSKPAVSR